MDNILVYLIQLLIFYLLKKLKEMYLNFCFYKDLDLCKFLINKIVFNFQKIYVMN